MKSQYDLWVESERQKIHDGFKPEREKVSEEAFLDGFNRDLLYDTGINKRAQERSEKLKEIDQRENVALADFMKTIETK